MRCLSYAEDLRHKPAFGQFYAIFHVFRSRAPDLPAAGNLQQVGVKDIIIQGDVLAPGGGFLHIGGQREYLELLIPGAVCPPYSYVRHLL